MTPAHEGLVAAAVEIVALWPEALRTARPAPNSNPTDGGKDAIDATIEERHVNRMCELVEELGQALGTLEEEEEG